MVLTEPMAPTTEHLVIPIMEDSARTDEEVITKNLLQVRAHHQNIDQPQVRSEIQILRICC